MFFCWNILPNLWTKIWRRLLGNPNIFDCNHIEGAKTKSETGLEVAVLGQLLLPSGFFPPPENLSPNLEQVLEKPSNFGLIWGLSGKLCESWKGDSAHDAVESGKFCISNELQHWLLSWSVKRFALDFEIWFPTPRYFSLAQDWLIP